MSTEKQKLVELWRSLVEKLDPRELAQKLAVSEGEVRELIRQLTELVEQHWSTSEACVLYVDGASRGNPGPSGLGIVVRDPKSGRTVKEYAFIGTATNNVAEYKALIRGLEKVRDLGYRRVEVRTDSELLVKQVTGLYRVKSPDLIPLWERVRELVEGFDGVELKHVPRDENREADLLSNQAIDIAVARGQAG